MGTIFDSRQFLHGLPLPGQKITYTTPTRFSFHTNVIEDEKALLEISKEYTVRKVQLNSSSTYVYLEEFWTEGIDEYRNNQKCFNMYAFDWEKPAIDTSKLIGLHYAEVTTLQSTYGFGINMNGEIWYEGTQVLYIETDKSTNRITKAEFKTYDHS
jgi:hypothetical protein